jgi:hypothetical protein
MQLFIAVMGGLKQKIMSYDWMIGHLSGLTKLSLGMAIQLQLSGTQWVHV